MKLETWARNLITALPAETQKALGANPLTAATQNLGLKIRRSNVLGRTRGANGWCDGLSLLDEGVVKYRSTGTRRDNFTILHECGHFFIDRAQDDAFIDWYLDHPDQRSITEDLCDLIASLLLISDDIVTSVVQDGPVAATHLGTLFDETNASRHACAVRLARQLPCEGLVTILDRRTQLVVSGARSGDTRPYAWRNDPVPQAHPLRRLRESEGYQRKSWWQRNHERREFYVDAFSENGRISAVFAELDLWGIERLHRPLRGSDNSAPRFPFQCPCKQCGSPPCPVCEECLCAKRERQTERGMCSNCMLTYRKHLLENGMCRDCR